MMTATAVEALRDASQAITDRTRALGIDHAYAAERLTEAADAIRGAELWGLASEVSGIAAEVEARVIDPEVAAAHAALLADRWA